jgi:hypothetical protein
MRAYLAKLTPKTWTLLAVTAAALAYPVVSMVLPAVVHAAVPAVLRTLFSLI